MKLYFTRFLLSILLLSSSAFADGFLWEVNGTKGGKVYLLGALDMGKQEIYPLNPLINQAFAKSSYLFLEQLRSVDNTVFTDEQLFKEGRLESNDTISNHMSKETYALLQAWLESLKLPVNSMDIYAPWVAALTLSSLDMALRGDEERLTIESYFYKKAQRKNKRIYGLERVADKLMRYKDMEYPFQERVLQSALDLRLFNEETSQEHFRAYKENNQTYFEQNLIEPYVNYPMIQERILWASNEIYFNKVLRYRQNTKGRSYFLIIGLEHILGEQGILARLKEAGLEVTAY